MLVGGVWELAPVEDGWEQIEIGFGVQGKLDCEQRKIWTMDIISTSKETHNKFKVECFPGEIY